MSMPAAIRVTAMIKKLAAVRAAGIHGLEDLFMVLTIERKLFTSDEIMKAWLSARVPTQSYLAHCMFWVMFDPGAHLRCRCLGQSTGYP
jgi:hypothetical protein